MVVKKRPDNADVGLRVTFVGLHMIDARQRHRETGCADRVCQVVRLADGHQSVGFTMDHEERALSP